MEAFASADELIASIIMESSGSPGAVFVIVEGDTDRRLYGPLLRAEAARLLVAGSREKGEAAALGVAKERPDRHALAILDADFERLEGRAPQAPSIFWTDGHDSEAMMLQSAALRKVLAERASVSKLETLRQGHRAASAEEAVREALRSRGRALGALRLHNQRAGLALDFKGLELGRKALPQQSWELDVGALVNLVRSRNTHAKLTNAALEAEVQAILQAGFDDAELCQGHDLLEILAIGLRRRLGDAAVQGEDLERELRLAFDVRCFAATRLYTALQAWAASRGVLALLA